MADQWPDLKFAFSREKDGVVYADTKFYRIFTKSLAGNDVSDYTLGTDPFPVSDEYKEGIIQSFGKVQEDLKKKISDGLPEHFCAIKKIRVLWDNKILVESLTSGGKPVFRLFDETGKMIRSFRIDPGFRFHTLKFFSGRIGMIEDREEFSVYHEFKINL